MSFSELEQRVLQAIDAEAAEIVAFGNQVRLTPELGYREWKTAAAVQRQFERLGLPYEQGLAVTGVKAAGPNREGPHVCVMGELDAVPCGEHPYADAQTGAAHACGHNAQLAAMVGAAVGLVKSGVLQELDGRVSFFAVPAEEYIDLNYRRGLKAEGKIEFFGGKQQLVAEGAFDDVDMAMMVHAHPETPESTVFVHGGSLGFAEKQFTFRGKAAHASRPAEGINALNAAALAILGMHTNRERFREEDKIRVHPIITKGGDVVNTVPDEVCMDSYVRGATVPGIFRASADTDRAAKGAAAMVGATVEIETRMGYFPLKQSHALGEVFSQVAAEFLPQEQIHSGVDMVGSSDIGDLSNLMPCIQPTMGGFTGTLHSKELSVANEDTAYVLPAKLMALTVVRLLENQAQLAKAVLDEYQPTMSKETYLMRLRNPGENEKGDDENVD